MTLVISVTPDADYLHLCLAFIYFPLISGNERQMYKIMLIFIKTFKYTVTVGELKVSPWLTAPGMEDEQLGRRGLSASQPMAERD